MANCCHPVYYVSGMKKTAHASSAVTAKHDRLQAITSTKEAGVQDNLAQLDPEDASRFAASMIDLHRAFGVRILGGCYGTDDRHIAALAEQYNAYSRTSATNKVYL